MKKLLIILLFFSFNSFSQIKKSDASIWSTLRTSVKIEIPDGSEFVGKANVLTEIIAEMYKKDNYYYVIYENQDFILYPGYDSFVFNDEDGFFDMLHKSIIEFIDAKGKKAESFDLPEGTLTLNKIIKFVNFNFTNKKGSTSKSGFMNKKQINKLFGKD